MEFFSYPKPRSVPGAHVERRRWDGREVVVAIDPDRLAAAYADGRMGQPLKDPLVLLAWVWEEDHDRRPSAHFSEGGDNPLIDWYCQGWRDYADAVGDINAVAALPIVENGETRFPVAMLWNLNERPALTNETNVRELLGIKPKALAAPSTREMLGLEAPK